MPTYLVTGPDGKKYRVTAPEGASEADVLARAKASNTPEPIDAARAKYAGAKPSDAKAAIKKGEARLAQNMKGMTPMQMAMAGVNFYQSPTIGALNDRAKDTHGRGLVAGLAKPVDNLARLAMNYIPGAKVIDDFGVNVLGLKPTMEVADANQRARETNTHTGAQFVGNVLATLPTAAIPGGPFVQGAATTGLLTDSKDPASIAAEMAVGGTVGKVADVAVRGIANKVAPKVSQTLGELTKRGVKVTPGMATRESQSLPGRFMTALEDRGASLPGPTGQAIRAGQAKATETFNRGGINEVLGELGKVLPDNISAGHESVAFAQKAASSAYDDALRGMDLVPDQQLATDLRSLVSNVRGGGISEPFSKQFDKLLENVVMRRASANGGNLSGDTLKTVLSELNQKAAKFNGSSVASEQEYGAVISALSDALEQAARRSSRPESVAALDAADRAYAKLVRIEGAAKNASGGLFSPGQLETSVRQSDSSVRKRAVSAGKGLLQDYATAGRKIIPSRIGDSGTAGREAMWSIPAWAFDLAAYGPYKAAEKIVPPMATRAPGATAMTIADLINMSAPAAAKAAPIIGYNLANER